MPPLSPTLNVMASAVRKASRVIRRDFGELENLQVSVKGPGDFVTQSDLATEKILRGELEKARPGYGFVMEEQGRIEGADKDHWWHIDPIDGTTNFIHGIPHVAISVGLERDGVLLAGVVYNPVREEMFLAERGKGAFFNDRRMRVSGRAHLKDAVIGTGVPVANWPDQPEFLAQLQAVMPEVAGIRRFGSAALDLAYVAAGRFDGFFERHLASWDVAAGIVLVREAGGQVTDMGGGPGVLENDKAKNKGIVAGNQDIHAKLLKVLKSVKVK